MMEVTLLTILSDFVKVVHVELNKGYLYLSNKGRVVAVLEIFRKDSLGEDLFIEDNEAYT